MYQGAAVMESPSCVVCPACCLHSLLIFPFITSPFGNCEPRVCRASVRGLSNLHAWSCLSQQTLSTLFRFRPCVFRTSLPHGTCLPQAQRPASRAGLGHPAAAARAARRHLGSCPHAGRTLSRRRFPRVSRTSACGAVK